MVRYLHEKLLHKRLLGRLNVYGCYYPSQGSCVVCGSIFNPNVLPTAAALEVMW